MTTYVSDDFNRANVSGTIGNPQIGPTPVVVSGVPAIVSNGLTANTGGVMIETWECGLLNVEIEAQQNSTSPSFGRFGGLALAVTAANDYIKFTFDGQTVWLSRVTASGEYMLASKPMQNSNTIQKLSYRDGLIRVWGDQVNPLWPAGKGELLYYQLDPVFAVTATRHGLMHNGGGISYFDYLVIRDAPALPALPTSSALAAVDSQTAVAPIPTAFTYRGRDTKTLDISGGA